MAGPRPWPGARRTASTTSSAWRAISVLHALAHDVAVDLKKRRAEAGAEKMRAFAAFAYAARFLEPANAGSSPGWRRPRAASIPATIVTSLSGEARHLYENVYCARGQAENLIKLHKGQLASDRTSCSSPLANQLRLVLHTGAYWLMLALRDAIPRAAPLAPRRVRHPQAASAQDRRPRRRKGRPRPHTLPPRPARTPPSSACWQGASRRQAPDRRGAVPRKPELPQPPTPATTNPETRCQTASGGKLTPRQRDRRRQRSMNRSG